MLNTLLACLPELFKRHKKDVSGRLETGPCCSRRINFDSFPFFWKLRILIVIALSLSEWMCWERFCSAQWLVWELKLETNCKLETSWASLRPWNNNCHRCGCSGSRAGAGGKLKHMSEISCSMRTEILEMLLGSEIIVWLAVILNHFAISLPKFRFQNKLFLIKDFT